MKNVNPMVCLSDSLSGGAAAACNRLGLGLVKQGVEHERWHFSPPRVMEFPCVELDGRRKRPLLERLMKNISRELASRMRKRRHNRAFLNELELRRPTCINVHNIHDSGLNHDSLYQIPQSVALSWTLHDRWPFAAEAFCWQDSMSGKWSRLCVDGKNEVAALERRKQFFRTRPGLCFIAPSRWLKTEVRSAFPKHRVEHVPYGIPTDEFAPTDRLAARKALGLHSDLVWLGFASTWGNMRKGADLLPGALARFAHQKIGLLIWGQIPEYEWPKGITLHSVGTLTDAHTLALHYSACDFFLCPSRADNLPNTVLESLSCGVPCLGANVGGIPDMARVGTTGWLIPEISVEGLAEGIRIAISQRESWQEMRGHCRQIAEEEYSLDVQAKAYLKLHMELMRDA
jgi:glycosyltransferase involved in cell wall biosynthesis